MMEPEGAQSKADVLCQRQEEIGVINTSVADGNGLCQRMASDCNDSGQCELPKVSRRLLMYLNNPWFSSCGNVVRNQSGNRGCVPQFVSARQNLYSATRIKEFLCLNTTLSNVFLAIDLSEIPSHCVPANFVPRSLSSFTCRCSCSFRRGVSRQQPMTRASVLTQFRNVPFLVVQVSVLCVLRISKGRR